MTCAVSKGIEEDGIISEGISFETFIKTLQEEDEKVDELFKELPPLMSLIRHVHKQAWWDGAEFGRLVFVKLDEDEQTREDSLKKDTKD